MGPEDLMAGRMMLSESKVFQCFSCEKDTRGLAKGKVIWLLFAHPLQSGFEDG